jgi:hypothetical protein
MASSSQKNQPIFMVGNFLGMLIMIDAMIMLFYLVIILLMLWLLLALLMFMVGVGLGEIMLLMPLGKCAINLLRFFMRATLLLYFHVKMQK